MADVRTVSPEELYTEYLSCDVTIPNQVSVLINMVATVDGVTTIPQGNGVQNEQGIGDPVDQKILHLLRVHADIVLNGANTLEISGSDSSVAKYPELLQARKQAGKTDAPIGSVITSKAEFSDEVLTRPFFTDASFSTILFVSEGAPEENLARARKAAESKGDKFSIEMLPKENSIDALLERIKTKYNAQTLLVEGGSGVNGSFVLAKRVNHIFFTESPNLAVSSPTSKTTITGPKTLSKDELVEMRLESCYYVEDSKVFKHYKVL